MNHNSLSARVSQALNSKNKSVQGHALSTMINEIEEFVEGYNDELDLIRDMSSLQRDEAELRKRKGENPDDQSIAQELKEVEELLRKAQQLKSQLRGKVQIIGQLKRDVQNLNRELSKARS